MRVQRRFPARADAASAVGKDAAALLGEMVAQLKAPAASPVEARWYEAPLPEKPPVCTPGPQLHTMEPLNHGK